MSPFPTLLIKQLVESRWFLGLVVMAMLALGWLGAYQTKSLLDRMSEGSGRVRGMGMMRAIGGPDYDGSTLAMEVARWNMPVVPLLVICWAIARGSAGVAGEIERGTLDLVISRPVARWSYLLSQVAASAVGLALIVAALVIGTLAGNWYYAPTDPPEASGFLRPSLNLFAMGLCVYGYTLVFSSWDVVRWRANLIGSTLTIGGLIAYLVANSEEMKENWHWLEWFSVFKGYAPVEAAIKGEQVAANVGALCGIGLLGVVIALVIFQARDLPSNS